MKKETLAQVFYCEFCAISKNAFSYSTSPVALLKSLMYNRNKSGPNIEPCGIPALILAQNKLWPLKILNDLRTKKQIKNSIFSIS